MKLYLSNTDSWLNFFENQPENRDFVILAKEDQDAIWFTTNFTQGLIVRGGSEVVPIYGSGISRLSDFIKQVNSIMPIGRRLPINSMALYDILLNFETEPVNRNIIWGDAQDLFMKNRTDFELIFELLVVSAYLNRNGESTIKQNGDRYKVNQRNIFVFTNIKQEDLNFILAKQFSVPSIDDANLTMQFEFNVIELVE